MKERFDTDDSDHCEWFYCEKCRKKIAKRLPGGRIEFVFGMRRDGDRKVFIRIDGLVEIKCLRRGCGHINTIDGRG
jgi:hypothetical protein